MSAGRMHNAALLQPTFPDPPEYPGCGTSPGSSPRLLSNPRIRCPKRCLGVIRRRTSCCEEEVREIPAQHLPGVFLLIVLLSCTEAQPPEDLKRRTSPRTACCSRNGRTKSGRTSHRRSRKTPSTSPVVPRRVAFASSARSTSHFRSCSRIRPAISRSIRALTAGGVFSRTPWMHPAGQGGYGPPSRGVRLVQGMSGSSPFRPGDAGKKRESGCCPSPRSEAAPGAGKP